MAKIYQNGKWKKRTLTALSLALATTFSFGMLSACANPADDEEEENGKVMPTDTQLIKNGDFEFYSDKLEDDVNGKPLKKLNIISSPDNWTFTSGSPSSKTKSGIIDTADWAYYSRTGGHAFSDVTKGEGDDEKTEKTFSSIADAMAHWEDEDVSAYDRLKFLDFYKDDISALAKNSEEAKFFSKYSYSVDFEDVEKLDEEVRNGSLGGVSLHPGAAEGEENKDKTSVLMIHNQVTSDSDGMRGTAQYYTSGTTVTLSAGTAAKVSVWVMTDALYHYKDTELSARGGAYIGITNTVGGTTLDQMQVYNIHTDGEWQQYTFYVRASTFATSTFRIVLGLGQGSSDDKYYAVDGYAFFDDVECTVMAGDAYEEALYNADNTLKNGVLTCSVDSDKGEKMFDYDLYPHSEYSTFGLDLYAGFDSSDDLFADMAEPVLTSEKSGANVYTSERIDPSLGDIESNFAKKTTLDELSASSNSYLKKVYAHDFDGKFPFKNEDLVMLLSSNGAAYTATLAPGKLFTLKPEERMLISFFVKTSEIRSGLSGAGATIVDGENKTSITPFDSTTISTVDIDSKSDDPEQKDIYKGWVQCFFFLENTTDSPKTFTLQLSYGPTAIVDSTKLSYCDGYAAFANFETKLLSKSEYSYASTSDRAKKVSLTGEVADSKNFDSVSAVDENQIEKGLALPANFNGVLGGSNYVTSDGVENIKPDTVDAGLLNYKYADKYAENREENGAWLDVLAPSATGSDWWTEVFRDARQPLVIVNRSEVSYGFYAKTATLAASSTRRLSVKVKAPVGVTAFVYLLDASADEDKTFLSPDLPGYTYWYDDDGNLVNMDPASDEYEEQGKVLYELDKTVGLYKKVGGDDSYYANFNNLNTDDEGNYVTSDGTIAFYKGTDDKYYAYREEDAKTGVYSYTTAVKNITDAPTRYDYTDKEALPETVIEVAGTGKWTTVNFYLRAGETAKSYALEVWNGSRDGKTVNKAGSYVLFDCYSSAEASDFDTQLSGDEASAVQLLKDRINKENNKTPGQEGYLGKDDELPQAHALYYTYTLFDSASFLRYDETEDSEGLGSPYYSYKQSEQEKKIVWLSIHEEAKAGEDEYYSVFLDYSETDKTVEDYPDNDTDTDEDVHDHDTEPSDMNIWLLISSGILAVVLLLVIVLLIVRRLMKSFGKKTRIKPAKDKRVKPKKTSDAE